MKSASDTDAAGSAKTNDAGSGKYTSRNRRSEGHEGESRRGRGRNAADKVQVVCLFLLCCLFAVLLLEARENNKGWIGGEGV